ncbi:MAG: CvpA family protein, partial [Micrococcales bacterium]|nr:CvpA family protein [Micrococcales bacterium]
MTGSTLLDIVLVLVLLAYSWSGWRQGLVAAVLGLVGLLGGAVLAAKVAPGLLDGHGGIDFSTPGGTLLLVAVVLVTATLGQWLMLLVASRIRSVISLAGLRLVDNLLGAVAVLVASVLVLWVVAGALRVSGPPPLRSAIASSQVVRTVDALVPRSAQTLVDDLTEALDKGGFPRVFEGLGPEPIVAVPAPDPALVEDPAVARALRSVIHVRAEAPRCGQTQVGSGWVVSPGVVVTNAHVVAGSRTVRLSVRGTGPKVTGRVVRFDPDR